MSNLDKLLEKGAQVVGGDLILRHKIMGQFRNGDFFVTPDGMEELEIVDVVEVKEVKKPAAKKVKAIESQAGENTAGSEDVKIDLE
jgi:hypothetical protein